jgi:hypothetical protein
VAARASVLRAICIDISITSPAKPPVLAMRVI